MSIDSILDEYDSAKNELEEAQKKIDNLLSEILQKLQIHQITFRIKERNSLSDKIRRKQKYTQLSDITDLIGFRIIVYYSDNIEDVVNLLRNEFDIDNDNSIDKRLKQTDEFGYSSYHLIAQLNQLRSKLKEYKVASKFKFEIQIRTLIQHQWAEIEHKLNYKSKDNLPTELKREFLKISVYTEDLDKRYIELREAAKKYRLRLKESLNISSEPLTEDSLFALLESSEAMPSILEKAEEYNLKILLDSRISFWTTDRLNYLGINTCGELEQKLNQHKDIIVPFVDTFLLDEEKKYPLHFDFAAFYLVYILMITEKEDYTHYAKEFELKESTYERLSECKKMLEREYNK